MANKMTQATIGIVVATNAHPHNSTNNKHHPNRRRISMRGKRERNRRNEKTSHLCFYYCANEIKFSARKKTAKVAGAEHITFCLCRHCLTNLVSQSVSARSFSSFLFCLFILFSSHFSSLTLCLCCT